MSDDRHECQCDRHDCPYDVKCPQIETPSGRVQFACMDEGHTHICEECEQDLACSGQDLNPQRWEGGLY